MVNVLLLSDVKGWGAKPGQPSSLLFPQVSQGTSCRWRWSGYWEQADRCDSELETGEGEAGCWALTDALERASSLWAKSLLEMVPWVFTDLGFSLEPQ